MMTIRHALRAGFTIEEIFNLTKIDRWFLTQIKEIVDFEKDLAGASKALATPTNSESMLDARSHLINA